MKPEIKEQIVDALSKLNLVHTEDIPEIELYMDQVTTFMERELGSMKRYPEDKILTKTMINNYAKNNLLPSPNKKKYNQEHIILMAMIYYLKNILSIHDIDVLLKPLQEKYFGAQEGLSLSDIYNQIASVRRTLIPEIHESLSDKYLQSSSLFQDVDSSGEQDYLQLLSLICTLSLDVYVKKFVIERLIDEMQREQEEAGKEKSPSS